MSDDTNTPAGDGQPPADQAKDANASPINGVVPPAEYRFPPGQSGNPKGRPAAGASVKEWWNCLCDPAKPASRQQLRRIIADDAEPVTKQAAAIQILQTLEYPDLADYAGLLRGENTLEDLRGMGIDTKPIKKFKQKTKKEVTVGAGPDGGDKVEEIIDREIEFHDRAGTSLDRILDRTDGRPTQAVKVEADITQHVKRVKLMPRTGTPPTNGNH